MYLHDQLSKARQDDLLRQAAHHRLVTSARRARARGRSATSATSATSVTSTGWPRQLVWAGVAAVVASPRVSRSEGGAR